MNVTEDYSSDSGSGCAVGHRDSCHLREKLLIAEIAEKKRRDRKEVRLQQCEARLSTDSLRARIEVFGWAVLHPR